MPKAVKAPSTSPYLDSMHSIGYLARINFRAFSRILEQLTLPLGVSAGQWRFLRVLWEQDNITQRELSDRVGTKEATTVHGVRSLISSGLAKRTRCTEDKRKIYITLTPRARRLRAKLMPMVAAVNEMALAGINPKDAAIARRVLAQTYANLEEQLGEANA
ncbi:MAG: MarR family winged helix-turn-helix transcriptional regulator [Pseudomonadales bacterium]